MSQDVKVPASGESITSANVARWHKAHGDAVAKGDILVTLETDKVSNELEADADGVLEILVNEGEEVDIGTVIARIAESTGAAPASQPAPAKADPAPAKVEKSEKSDKPEEPPAPSGDPIEIKVPASGESITSANVSSWRKKDGEAVAKGDILVSLETDKVSTEVEAPADGVLKILVSEGEEVPIGAVIATIEPGAQNGARTSVRPPPAEAPQKAEPPANSAPSPPHPPNASSPRSPPSPAANLPPLPKPRPRPKAAPPAAKCPCCGAKSPPTSSTPSKRPPSSPPSTRSI